MALTPDLKDIDRDLDRWAAYKRSERFLGQTLHPIARAMRQAEGAALPGGEREMPDHLVLLDRVIARSSTATRLIVTIWYVNGGPVTAKAKRLKIARSTLYQLWEHSLRILSDDLNQRKSKT